MAGGFPDFGNPFVPGVRSTPGYQPTPNSEPMGSITGVPVRTRLYSVPLLPGSSVQIVPPTRENRVALITTPAVGFTVYVASDGGASADTGMALPAGQTTEVIIPGFQEIYAITDAPVTLRISIQIAPILLAERERRL